MSAANVVAWLLGAIALALVINNGESFDHTNLKHDKFLNLSQIAYIATIYPHREFTKVVSPIVSIFTRISYILPKVRASRYRYCLYRIPVLF